MNGVKLNTDQSFCGIAFFHLFFKTVLFSENWWLFHCSIASKFSSQKLSWSLEYIVVCIDHEVQLVAEFVFSDIDNLRILYPSRIWDNNPFTITVHSERIYGPTDRSLILQIAENTFCSTWNRPSMTKIELKVGPSSLWICLATFAIAKLYKWQLYTMIHIHLKLALTLSLSPTQSLLLWLE